MSILAKKGESHHRARRFPHRTRLQPPLNQRRNGRPLKRVRPMLHTIGIWSQLPAERKNVIASCRTPSAAPPCASSSTVQAAGAGQSP